jgi:hypothetical protein
LIDSLHCTQKTIIYEKNEEQRHRVNQRPPLRKHESKADGAARSLTLLRMDQGYKEYEITFVIDHSAMPDTPS